VLENENGTVGQNIDLKNDENSTKWKSQWQFNLLILLIIENSLKEYSEIVRKRMPYMITTG
jgi:hypothetical protein